MTSQARPRVRPIATQARGATKRPNKELKLTKPCTIGASQLTLVFGRLSEEARSQAEVWYHQ